MIKKDKKKSQYTKEDRLFLNALQTMPLPILTLDPNWHALFPDGKKPLEVRRLERKLTELLKEQGKLTTDNKQLQLYKKQLMGKIINNMAEFDEASEKQKAQQKEKIEKINSSVCKNEDELVMLPQQIRHVNEELLLETLKTVYDQMQVNDKRIAQLQEYIMTMRKELTEKLLEKQNREDYNKEIISNIDHVVGRDAAELYDKTHHVARREE